MPVARFLFGDGMKKETIKTIILTLLIVNCVQLTAQIWLNKKLWPEGYNFFSYVQSLPIVRDITAFFDKNSSAGQISNTTTLPDKIVLNGGGARVVHHSGDDEFFSTIETISPYMEQVFSMTSQEIAKEDWQAMLRGKSVYVDFGFNIDGKNLAAIFGSTVSASSTFSDADAMVLYPEATLNTTSVCFKNTVENSYIKYSVSNDTQKLLKFIEDKTIGEKNEQAFAFELRLDEASSPTGIEKKVVLASDVLLSMESKPLKKLKVSKVFENKNHVLSVADDILSAFGSNPSRLRMTVNEEGIVSYVENSATIKVYPDGLVEYNAITTEKGIKIADGQATTSKIINEVLKIAEKVVATTDPSEQVILKLRTPLSETPVTSYVARFDRYYNGLPVIDTKNNPEGNALYAQFENGYIKSFKIQLKNLSLAESEQTPPTVIETIDKMFELPFQKVTIDNLMLCYFVDGDIEVPARWSIKHDGEITIP